MVEIRGVDEALLGSHGLSVPIFPFLSPEPGYIRVAMFQPQGVIAATADGVRALDHVQMNAQMRAFLSYANAASADLVACPEYSCTWDALGNAIEAGITPPQGSLWLIGCESLQLSRLDAQLSRLRGHARVIYGGPTGGSENAFLDCLCYVFQAENYEGTTSTVVLIQAKTHQMGGDDYEYAHLACGNVIYQFGGGDLNRLVTLLCSDVLGPSFQEKIVPHLLERTLVVHLQLNPNPSAPTYRAYRDACCSVAPRNTEILWLNWAAGTKLDGAEEDLIVEPKTMLFRPMHELDTSEGRIAANHELGCFLSYHEQLRSAVFTFAPQANVFHFQTTKPFVAGPAANAIRFGPRMVERMEWVGGAFQVCPDDSADQFNQYWLCALVAPHVQPYLPRKVDIERLIQFCIGRSFDRDWNDWRRLPSFRLESDDTSCRLSVCWATTGRGATYRDSCRSDFQGFVRVLAQPSKFSARLERLKHGAPYIRYNESPTYLRFRNLHSSDGNRATAVFLGFNPPQHRLASAKRALVTQLADVNEDPEMLAIWHLNDDGSLADFMEGDDPSFVSDPSIHPAAITNPRV